MRNIRTLICCLLFGFFGASFSHPTKIFISIVPKFGNDYLRLSDSAFSANDSNNLQIETVKFYISNIQLLYEGKVVLTEKNSVHLIDASDRNVFQFTIENNLDIEFDEMKFNLGIDSATNVSGALGECLDPTNGMYWTWHNGYINFKLEGKSNFCTTRNNEFQFHLGGYQQPNYCLQTVVLKIKKKVEINLIVDVEKVLKQIDLSKQNHIISPSNEAVFMSKIVANSFSIIDK